MLCRFKLRLGRRHQCFYFTFDIKEINMAMLHCKNTPNFVFLYQRWGDKYMTPEQIMYGFNFIAQNGLERTPDFWNIIVPMVKKQMSTLDRNTVKPLLVAIEGETAMFPKDNEFWEIVEQKLVDEGLHRYYSLEQLSKILLNLGRVGRGSDDMVEIIEKTFIKHRKGLTPATIENAKLGFANPGRILAGANADVTVTAAAAGSLAGNIALALTSNANGVTGLANAMMDSIPLVVLTGQVPTFMIGTDGFQEADTVGITRPCTKHNWLVKDTDKLADVIHQAFHVATKGRPGPVLIDIPKDVQFATGTYHPPRKSDVHISYAPRVKGDAAQLRNIDEAISESRRDIEAMEKVKASGLKVSNIDTSGFKTSSDSAGSTTR